MCDIVHNMDRAMTQTAGDLVGVEVLQVLWL